MCVCAVIVIVTFSLSLFSLTNTNTHTHINREIHTYVHVYEYSVQIHRKRRWGGFANYFETKLSLEGGICDHTLDVASEHLHVTYFIAAIKINSRSFRMWWSNEFRPGVYNTTTFDPIPHSFILLRNNEDEEDDEEE